MSSSTQDRDPVILVNVLSGKSVLNEQLAAACVTTSPSTIVLKALLAREGALQLVLGVEKKV